MSNSNTGNRGNRRTRSYALWPALLWLTLAVIGIATNYAAGRTVVSKWLVFYAWITLICSLVAIAMFWIDKRAAIRSKSRISERSLYIIAAVGGWPGAVVGQQTFRHKSQKISFRTVLWLIVILHLVVVSTLVYQWIS